MTGTIRSSQTQLKRNCRLDQWIPVATHPGVESLGGNSARDFGTGLFLSGAEGCKTIGCEHCCDAQTSPKFLGWVAPISEPGRMDDMYSYYSDQPERKPMLALGDFEELRRETV